MTEPCHQQKFKIVFPRRFHRPSDIFHDSSPTNWVPSRFGRQRVHPFRLTPVASGNSKSYCICPNVKILHQWIKHVNFHDFSWFLSSIVRLYRLIAWGCIPRAGIFGHSMAPWPVDSGKDAFRTLAELVPAEMDLENQPLRWGPFWRCVLFKNMVSIYKLYIHIYSYLMDFNGMWAPKASTTWYQWTVIMYLWKLWDASSTWMCILYDRIYILESCMDFLRGTSPNRLILTLHFHPVCHLRNDTGNKWERSPHTFFIFFY